jgi:hypothetical protein
MTNVVCFTLATCIWDWHASDNKLPGTPRGSRQKQAGRQHAVSGRPMLIHTYHVVPMPSPCHEPAEDLRCHFQKGIFVAWQGNGMVCVNQTRPLCVNQMGKTQSKPLAEQHGRGTAWYVWIGPYCLHIKCYDFEVFWNNSNMSNTLCSQLLSRKKFQFLSFSKNIYIHTHFHTNAPQTPHQIQVFYHSAQYCCNETGMYTTQLQNSDTATTSFPWERSLSARLSSYEKLRVWNTVKSIESIISLLRHYKQMNTYVMSDVSHRKMYPNANVEGRKLILDDMITGSHEAHPASYTLGTCSPSCA